jgi:hypothetical protein
VLWSFSCRITHLRISVGEFAGRIRAAATKNRTGAKAEVKSERVNVRYSTLCSSSCTAPACPRVRLAQGGLAHPGSPLCSAQQRSRRVGRECERFNDLLGRSRLGDDGAPAGRDAFRRLFRAEEEARTPSSFNRRATAECSGLSGLQSRLAEEKSNASSRSIASAASRATTSPPNRCKAECKVRAASGCPSMSGVACPLRKCRSTSPFVPARSLSLTALIAASAVHARGRLSVMSADSTMPCTRGLSQEHVPYEPDANERAGTHGEDERDGHRCSRPF